MSFSNIPKDWKPEINYWDYNPQIRFINPFSKMYDTDNGKDESSKKMWCCAFFHDPDEEVNRFFRLSTEQKKQALTKYYPKLDWDDELFQECLDAYPFECLNSIQRALHDELESLKARAKLIRDTERTIDHYMTNDMGELVLDKSDKPILIKGNSTQLDTMQSKTAGIYMQLEKIIERFKTSKEDTSRVFGGRKKTLSEKGLM